MEPNRALQDKPFLVLLVVISLAFAWILWPFYGAIFWATILAILFAPLYARLAKALRERCTLAALAAVAIILLLVILPSALVTGMLLQEGFQVYGKLRSGEWNIGSYFAHLYAALPGWLTTLQLGAAVMQLARLGSPERMRQALDILKEARRRIYTLLAESD